MKRHRVNTGNIIKTVATSPAVLLGVGDTVLALAAAEISGFLLNACSAAVAICGGVYHAVTGKKIGIGFYSAAGVSAYTVGSILYRGAQENTLAAATTLLPALAFFFWTIANLMAGWREARHARTKGLLGDHHVYFSLGAMAAGSNNPVSTVIFALSIYGLHRVRKTCRRTDDATPDARSFLIKHATPKRLRGIAYAVSALAAVCTISTASSPDRAALYAAAYVILMLANFSFDKEKNKCVGHDLGTGLGFAPVMKKAVVRRRR